MNLLVNEQQSLKRSIEKQIKTNDELDAVKREKQQ